MPLVPLAPKVSAATSPLVSLSIENLFPPDLAQLIAKLHVEYQKERVRLLAQRKIRQDKFDSGDLPQFANKSSQAVSEKWMVAPIPKDLQTRRVEITGPVNDAKMAINMLNRNSEGHRADTAMLDFEDSMRPTWGNVLSGYQNIRAICAGDLTFIKVKDADSPEKIYQLNSEDMAHPMIRVRGLHLLESNFLVDGEAVSAGLLDLVTCAYFTAKDFIKQGKTAKYYVPKCEHFEEARWWHDLFSSIEKELYLPHASLRVTFLIETLPAAYLMEEILYEIKDRAVALNVGRWDKIFSDIKILREHKDRIAPDRASIGMDRSWMENYARRLVKICHSRGAMAIGGMSAATPGKDKKIREAQMQKVLQDKEREYRLGHDGCWVSHPYFINIAMSAFKNNSQIEKKCEDFDKYPDLLMKGLGPYTLSGLRTNLRVGIAYLKGWNQGLGCISFDHLMEDLATLEISRVQTWQWLHHNIKLDDGKVVTHELVSKIFEEELDKILSEIDSRENPEDYKIAKEQALILFTKSKLDNFLCEVSPKAF